MRLIAVSILSYLLGSVPFALIFAAGFKGKDVRQEGSGNIGAANALVTAGFWVGLLSLVCDLTKGLVPVLLARLWVGSNLAVVMAAFLAVAGHDFPIFLKFRGGKGVATTAGAVIAIDPFMFIFLFLLWVLMVIVVQHFIPSTVAVICLLPLFMWFSAKGWLYILLGMLLAGLAIWQHRLDLERFFEGKDLPAAAALKKYLGR
jgi:glycerol-3-phosphate acyltransferase PlsY